MNGLNLLIGVFAVSGRPRFHGARLSIGSPSGSSQEALEEKASLPPGPGRKMRKSAEKTVGIGLDFSAGRQATAARPGRSCV